MKIAAYLLNPLKNEYTYEDVAKDYLEEMIPSRMDLIGKLSLQAAEEEKQEEFLNCVCYQAYVNLCAPEKLTEQMKQEEN